MTKKTYSTRKGDGGHSEEIHAVDDLAVVGEKGAPLLRCVGIGWAAGDKAGDGAFGDLEAELLHLAVDARRAPSWILGDHPAHEGTDLGLRCRASSAAPRSPTPISFEALAVPSDHRRGLHDGERFLPSRPPASQGKPEKAICHAKAGPGVPPLQDGKLLAEREVFEHEVGAAAEDRPEDPERGEKEAEHSRTMQARSSAVNQTGTAVVGV